MSDQLRPRRRVGALGVAAVVGLLGVGCGNGHGSDPLSAVPLDGTFPVTVHGVDGAFTVATRPSRIATPSSALAELLGDIGAGDQVIASGSGTTASATAAQVADLHPDLVVLDPDTAGLGADLTVRGIAVLRLPPADDLDGVVARIGVLGGITGNPAGAAEVIDSVRSDAIALVHDGREQAVWRHRVYVELDPSGRVLGSTRFLNWMLQQIGLVPVDSHRDPEVVVLADTHCCAQSASALAARPGWAGIRAVRTGRIVEADDDAVASTGPKALILARSVVASLAGPAADPGSAATPGTVG